MQPEHVPFIGEKWRTASPACKAYLLIGFLFTILVAIFTIIVLSDQAYPIVMRLNLTRILNILCEEHVPALLVSNILLLILEACLVLIIWEGNVFKTKQKIEALETLEYLHERLLQENEELKEQIRTGKVLLSGTARVTSKAEAHIRVLRNTSLFKGKSAEEQYKIYKKMFKLKD